MPTNVPPRRFDRQEPIPGYRTLDLLGRGGYGEVWRAMAPGGIGKAVKIVYGDGNASQAATELKALARVKDLRHPMLLSLERIEFIDGILVLVTELADGSLKDQFVKCRGQQQVGVPQEDLLRYVADAAEGLDFLFEKCSLQHLDVKPENILLVGGRAKVGDFGLVKSLYERSASMVGGLTPTYAPPELFEGKPSRHSDQYSLAIVYMHMLTGALPFAASNMAQLAREHLSGIPDLSSLPKKQRAVVARALSKDPSQRYGSCAEMVAALREAARESETPALPASPPPTLEPQSAAPETKAPGTLSSTGKPPLPSGNSAIRPIAHADSLDRHPVVLIAVGGAGVEVAAKVAARLRDRCGPPEDWPAVEMLVLDSNARGMSAQFQESDFRHVQLVPMPLRTTEEYAPRAADFLRWLSRRWFYNLPRDTASAGYRPFGRLALLTHARSVLEAIKAVLTRATSHPQASNESPRVLFVGSISGGTGSGAILDLSYAVRTELKSRGLSDDQTLGLLLHATGRANADRDRARANAYAALTELHHYSRPGGHFPGESFLGVPPFHGDNATFGQAHVLHLGEGLGPSEWDLATDHVAELVYDAYFTAAGSVLLQAGPESCGASAQSFGVLSLGAGNSRTIQLAGQQARNEVVRLWREGRTPESDEMSTSHPTVILKVCEPSADSRLAEIEQTVADQLASCRIACDDLTRYALESLELEVGNSFSEFAARMLDEALTATRQQTDESQRVDAIVGLMDRLLQCKTECAAERNVRNSLSVQLAPRMATRTRSCIEAFLEWIRGLVGRPELRVAGARRHATAARQVLQSLHEKLLAQALATRETANANTAEAQSPECQQERSRRSGWSRRGKSPDDALRETLRPVADLHLREFLLRVAAGHVRGVDAEIGNSPVIDQLDRLAADLSLLTEGCRRDAAEAAEGEDDSSGLTSGTLAEYRRSLGQFLRARQPDIVHRIDQTIHRTVFAGGGLQCLLAPEVDVQDTLWKPLAETSRQAVLECLRGVSCQLVTGTKDLPPAVDLVELIRHGFSGAGAFAAAGFVSRVLIVPEDVDSQTLHEQVLAACLDITIVRGRRCDLTLCGLHRSLPLFEVANGIIGGIDVYKQLASRLHTRSDVVWTPLANSPAPPLAGMQQVGDASFPSQTAMIPV